MTTRKARVSRPVDGLVGRARGFHKHVEGRNGHRLRVLGPPGTIDCAKRNCEINQPCDSQNMEKFR